MIPLLMFPRWKGHGALPGTGNNNTIIYYMEKASTAKGISNNKVLQKPTGINPPAGRATDCMQPRGIRNNNPLNIRFNARNQWKGLQGHDRAGFCIFENQLCGYRAAWIIMQQYEQTFRRLGICFNIRNIIRRWAPANENLTEKYIAYVAGNLLITADQPLNWMRHHKTIVKMMGYMAQYENGRTVSIAWKVIEDAYKMVAGYNRQPR